MTSTAPISQPVAAPSAEPGERGGRGGSKTTDDNAFSGLLSKMAAGNQDGVRREGKAEGEPSQPEGEPSRRPFVWVAVSADVIGDAPARRCGTARGDRAGGGRRARCNAGWRAFAFHAAGSGGERRDCRSEQHARAAAGP